ncbi:MAG: PHP domain-containing protein [Lachnospiraceae bacterium]|nr:PHP domain-containing protein [Lachnospiraceae bacterium]
MKMDMHCHTKEGSIDAKVDIFSYIRKLKEEGFDGMLVTDHNSYDGYRTWKQKVAVDDELGDFTVLKGIEYDTRDGGHMIAILPDGVKCRLLELRGMTVNRLEHIVHHLGGILGPAHPYGTGFFAAMHTRHVKKNFDILKKFDFIETFNSYNHPSANQKARELAEMLDKPETAGSDAHRSEYVGTAGTVFDRIIKCNNDLITAIKEKYPVKEARDFKEILQKKENLILKQLGIVGYWIYNKIGAFSYTIARKIEYYRHDF